MKIKTNVRAGKNGADDVLPDTSSSNQKQNGKSTTVPVSRCVGI